MANGFLAALVRINKSQERKDNAIGQQFQQNIFYLGCET